MGLNLQRHCRLQLMQDGNLLKVLVRGEVDTFSFLITESQTSRLLGDQSLHSVAEHGAKQSRVPPRMAGLDSDVHSRSARWFRRRH